MKANIDNTLNLTVRTQRRATALCAEALAGRATKFRGEPVSWKQLAKADERGEVCEGLLRIVLAGVLISTMLTGILW